MVARLGNVLYWVGCIAAVFVLAWCVLVWMHGASAKDMIQTGVFAIIIAGVFWGIGRACRYVLAGR
jgi:hypothetical protein